MKLFVPVLLLVSSFSFAQVSQIPQPSGGGGGSGTVTNSGTLTLNLPVIGNGGADTKVGTRQGNTTQFVTFAGSAPAVNDCAKWDASGNIVTSGSGCGGTTAWGAITGTLASQTDLQTALNGKQATGSYGLTTNPLSQFAATSSSQLLGVLNDETGTGLAVFNTNATLVTPILGTPQSVTLTNATGLPVCGTVNPAIINLQCAPYYASGSAVTTTTSGSTSPGTVVTVASCSSFVGNQGVFILGAGVAGANYVGTVVNCSSTTMIVSPATATIVSSGTLVQHDDTGAIQSAITALTNIGGTILFPDGYYRVNGPLQDTSGANALVIFPAIQTALGTGVTITLAGTTSPTPAYGPFMGSFPVGGVVIKTEATSGNLFGAYGPLDDFGDGRHFAFVTAIFRNLILRSYANPLITMLNGTHLVNLTVDNVSFETTITGATPTQPTHSNGRALLMPEANNGGLEFIRNVQVNGYYTAILASEHTDMQSVLLNYNYHCLELDDLGSTLSGFHPIYGARLMLQECTYGIIQNGSGSVAIINELGFENQVHGDWSDTTASIYDPGSGLKGYIWYKSRLASLVLNGATKVVLTDLLAVSGGSVVTTTVTSLPALTTIGTIGTGIWNGTSIGFGYGGTGLTSAANSTVLLSNGSAWLAKSVPDCQDVTGNHLNFTASSNTITCGTTGGGGGGSTSITASSPVIVTPSPITGTGVVSLNVGADFTFTTSQTVTEAVGATSTDGWNLITSSVATAGNQKLSPRIHFKDSGWKTNSTAGAQVGEMILELVPFQGVAQPDSYFTMSSAVAGGSFTRNLLIGPYPGFETSYVGIWPGGVTPATNNWIFISALDGSDTQIGSSTSVVLNGQTSFRNVLNGADQIVISSGAFSKYKGITTSGPGVPPIFGRVSLTGRTAAISSTTLCSATTTCGSAQYVAHVYLTSTATCSVAGPAGVGINIIWVDETGSHTAAIPLSDNSALTFATTMPLGDTTSYASGVLSFFTHGGADDINYSTSYTGCTTGMGTYTLRISLEQIG